MKLTMFKVGEIVYLKTDREQKSRIITGVLFQGNNDIEYRLACGDTNSWHRDYEISTDKDLIKSFE